MSNNELINNIIFYLNKLKILAKDNHRNSAYIKGVRDAIKIVQSFKEKEEEKI